MTARGRVHNGVVILEESTALPEGAEVLVEVVSETPVDVTAARKRRQGGCWKGRVRIADDFDELPDDLADAFGMRVS